MTSSAPTYDSVCQAQERLAGFATRTPLLRARSLEAALAAKRIYIKPEGLQRTGSFKFRGAFNAIACLSDEQRAGGIIAFSSGNHAQGVAAAAAHFGVPATILMPEDAPTSKLERTRALGAEVITFDRYTQSREEAVAAIMQGRSLTLIPPFDMAEVIAGQGTTALEVCEDLKAEKIKPDYVLIPCGGGGLSAGSALVFQKHFPKAKFYTVEPENFDDAKRSFAQGSRQKADISRKSVCDALLSEQLGKLTFDILAPYVTAGLSVSDTAAMQAVAYAFSELKLAAEPGGAVALAAILTGQIELRNKTAVLYISGANVDASLLLRALMMI